MIWMCDGDQCLRPLSDRSPKQLRDPILGDDRADMGPGRHHAGSWPQMVDDPRDRTVSGRRGEGDDRPALLRQGCAADEVHLTAHAAVQAMADGIRDDLAVR